jgi:hypothetical protein
MKKHVNRREESSDDTLHSFLVMLKSLEGKWSRRGHYGSLMKVGTGRVSMMAHRLSSRGGEIVNKSTLEGDGDVWVIIMSLHLVSSIINLGREQLSKTLMFAVSVWGICLFGGIVCDMARLGSKKGKVCKGGRHDKKSYTSLGPKNSTRAVTEAWASRKGFLSCV